MEDAADPGLEPITECGYSSAAPCSYSIKDFRCKTFVSYTILMRNLAHKIALRISTENEREVFTVCVRYRDFMPWPSERDL
jgi:hypothetical protein